MRYVTRVRKNGEARSMRFESDSIKELWHVAYTYARRCKNEGAYRVSFRIWDEEADNRRKYARFYM